MDQQKKKQVWTNQNSEAYEIKSINLQLSIDESTNGEEKLKYEWKNSKEYLPIEKKQTAQSVMSTSGLQIMAGDR